MARESPEHAPILGSILDVTDETTSTVILVGAVIKMMKKRHTVLDEYVKEAWIDAPPVEDSYVGEDDSIVLEDESGTIALTGDPDILPVGTLLTGMVIGVAGVVTDDGEFAVSHLYRALSGLDPPVPTTTEDATLLFVSDLGIGSTANPKTDLARDLLLDWLAGNLSPADNDSEATLASQVHHVVVAGNGLAPLPPADPAAGRKMDEVPSVNTDALAELDAYMAALASLANVVFLPGVGDPTNYFHPIQPIHRSLLPKAGRYDSLSLSSSPASFSLGGVSLLGESGAALSDARKYVAVPDSGDDNPAALLADILSYGHIAPTAPETLPAYPYKTSDPFVVTTPPALAFAGSQPTFGSSPAPFNSGSTSCLSIPSFATTHTAVIVRLVGGQVKSTTPLTFL